jgi:hypothetical protein
LCFGILSLLYVATIPSEVANISKNLIGSGVLCLSGGIAIYADSPEAIWFAILWIVALGLMFGYFCILIGKVCKLTGSASYREVSSTLVEIPVVLLLFASNSGFAAAFVLLFLF